MKNLPRLLLTRAVFVLFFTMLSLATHAQKDILLYSTDFTDWGQTNDISSDLKSVYTTGTTTSVSSSTVYYGTSAGEGFSMCGKPAVTPTGTIAGQTGFMYFANSSSEDNPYFKVKPLDFISGGVVVIEMAIANTTSARTLTLNGATSVSIDAIPSDAVLSSQLINGTAISAVGTVMSGNAVTIKNKTSTATGIFKVSFYFPSTFKGSQAIQTSVTKDACSLQYVAITSMKIYTGVGTTPYVASTNYSKYPAGGEEFTGTLGGAKYSGTATNSKVNIKAWNCASNVDLSIEGDGASRFSFSNTSDTTKATIANTSALSGTDLDIYFSPSSIKAGVSNAKLKISSKCTDSVYYVSLTGITNPTTTTPSIIANTDTLAFWTRVITNTTNSLDISGLNLTGPISLSITGAGASRFSLSTSTITAAESSSTNTVTITYLGDIDASTQNATLELTSTGAATVKIPLVAYTYNVKPTMYPFVVKVSPSGSGYANLSPSAINYIQGSKVTATITAENGYYLEYWSDRKGGTRTTRTLTISDETPDTLIAYLVKTEVPCSTCGENTASFHAYVPTNVTNTSFTVSWPAVSGATSYTVNIYDESGTLIKSISPVTGTTSPVTDLSAGTLYYYQVKTDTGLTTEKVGPYKTTGTSTVFTCGQ